MTLQSVRVHVDYVDPLSFILVRRLRARIRGTAESGAEPPLLRFLPFELFPPPMPLVDPELEAWRARWSRAFEILGADDPEIRAHPLVPWTRKAHELAEHAAEKGLFDDMHSVLFEAHLVRGLDIGRVDVLVELAGSIGLDRTEVKAVLDVDRFSERIEMLRAQALETGVRVAPTIVTADGIVLPMPMSDALLEHAVPRG